MKTFSRKIEPKLLNALKVSPVLFLNGPRQAGKSTLVQDIAKKISSKQKPAEYISFDRPIQMAAATSQPEAFLSNRTSPLIIDEVQMVPELFRALKTVVDEMRRDNKVKANGRFLLTGSANIMALPKLSDSLVGRMSVMTLYPFCVAESISSQGNGLDRIMAQDFTALKNSKVSLIEAIKQGTFPEIITMSSNEQSVWFDGYLTTLLQRDVRMLAELDKISLLPSLLRLLATRAGSLINEADIARGIGFNPVTAKVYRTTLQMMFLTFDVRPWYRNIGKRLVKSPKGYLTDSLLLCHLLDMKLEDLYKKRPEIFGHIAENFVATELLKLLTFSHTKAQLLHFRTADGKEVDFVLEKPNGEIFGIEVKTSEFITGTDFKGLSELAKIAKKDFIGGIVLYPGKEVVPFGENLWAVPFCILWQ